MLKPLKDYNSTDINTSSLMTNLREWAKQFQDIEILQGRLVENIELTASNDYPVFHKLNRPPKGWFVVSKDATGDIWEVSKDSDVLRIESDADLTISIWVF